MKRTKTSARAHTRSAPSARQALRWAGTAAALTLGCQGLLGIEDSTLRPAVGDGLDCLPNGHCAVGGANGAGGEAASGATAEGGSGTAGGSAGGGRTAGTSAGGAGTVAGTSTGGTAGMSAGGSGTAGMSAGGSGTAGRSAGGGGTAGTSAGSGGTAGTSAGGGGTAGTGGSGGAPPVVTPYSPRAGRFKMLAYSRTTGFRHSGSILTGKTMLQEIGAQQGFDVELTETNEKFTKAGLAEFEIVFFMNTTGDVLNSTEEAIFQEWMTDPVRGGAFGGTHSATDTEKAWPFYLELVGQYFDGHSAGVLPGKIQFEASALNHPAVKGLPNPWALSEEWWYFNSYMVWSAKPGMQILGRKDADGQPIAWVREFGNYRSFYTGLGHDPTAFQNPEIKKHVAGGIMWAVRREHLLK